MKEYIMAIKWDSYKKKSKSIFDTIGRTPMVRLNKNIKGERRHL
jgi:hypothetical protein